MDKLIVKVNRIVDNTPDSKTFYLDPGSVRFDYRAGQFITLLLQINGRSYRRSYSFSSTPGVDQQPFITIKKVDNGYISRYLLSHIKQGDLLEVLPSGGRFLLEHELGLHHFFIAAGSGITPIFSLIKEALYFERESTITLLYQDTQEQTSIFRTELLALQDAFMNRFSFIELFSRPVEHTHEPPRRLNNTLLGQLLMVHAQPFPIHFYLCGPAGFMQMALFTLRVTGYNDQQISKENFVVDAVPPPPFKVDPTPRDVSIKYRNQLYEIKVSWPSNILETALHNGIQLPYSCKGGRCSVCAAVCSGGSVKMSINDVLTEKDLAKGLVLTCVGYPESDITLDFDYLL